MYGSMPFPRKGFWTVISGAASAPRNASKQSHSLVGKYFRSSYFVGSRWDRHTYLPWMIAMARLRTWIVCGRLCFRRKQGVLDWFDSGFEFVWTVVSSHSNFFRFTKLVLSPPLILQMAMFEWQRTAINNCGITSASTIGFLMTLTRVWLVCHFVVHWSDTDQSFLIHQISAHPLNQGPLWIALLLVSTNHLHIVREFNRLTLVTVILQAFWVCRSDEQWMVYSLLVLDECWTK